MLHEDFESILETPCYTMFALLSRACFYPTLSAYTDDNIVIRANPDPEDQERGLSCRKVVDRTLSASRKMTMGFREAQVEPPTGVF